MMPEFSRILSVQCVHTVCNMYSSSMYYDSYA